MIGGLCGITACFSQQAKRSCIVAVLFMLFRKFNHVQMVPDVSSRDMTK